MISQFVLLVAYASLVGFVVAAAFTTLKNTPSRLTNKLICWAIIVGVMASLWTFAQAYYRAWDALSDYGKEGNTMTVVLKTSWPTIILPTLASILAAFIIWAIAKSQNS